MSDQNMTQSARAGFQRYIEPINQLEKENEALEPELRKRHRQKWSGRIGYFFLLFGIAAFVLAFFYPPIPLAFIGISLALWGALLLYIRPVRYVKAELISSAEISSLLAIDKVIEGLNYKGKGIYLPSKYFKGFKIGTIFIPADENTFDIPNAKEVQEGGIFLNNPKGLCIVAPGAGLVNLFEKELGTNFATTNIDRLRNGLSKLLVEDLEIMRDFEMNRQGNMIQVKMIDPVFKDLCIELRESTAVCNTLGCTLCGSLACTFAKATDRPVVLEMHRLTEDGKVIEATYRIMER